MSNAATPSTDQQPTPASGPRSDPATAASADKVDFHAVLARLFDPTLVIALLVAILYFSGWTYYRACLIRLGLDPAGMGLANFALAAEGAGALLTALGFWLVPIFAYLVVLSLLVLGMVRFEQHYAGRGWLPDVATLTYLMLRIVLFVSIAWLFLEAGTKAGTEKANAQFRSVGCGDVLDYQTTTGIIHGVTVAQADGRIWVLTRLHVIPIKLDDLKTIGGTLLEKARLGRGGCAIVATNANGISGKEAATEISSDPTAPPENAGTAQRSINKRR